MNTELRQEQERLDSIMSIIVEQIGMLENETSQRRKEVIDFRKHFWDDVKVNTDTFDDYLETIIALRQQAQNLSVSQSTHRQAFKRLSALRRMQKVPYFGRIDFIEEGSSAAERIYIGISTLTDTSGENILIYDWRAPVSSVYYDYAPGPGRIYYSRRHSPRHAGEKVAIYHPRRRYQVDVRYESHHWRRHFTAGAWQSDRQTYAQHRGHHSTGTKPDHPS